MIPNTPQEKPVANAITPDKRNNRNGRNTAGTAYFTISPERKVPASNAEIINNICLPAKVPVIAGEEGICSGCGVATLSISYYDLGKATGEMAVKILKDGEDISTMPIEYAPNFTKEYNADICAELGIEVPDDYVAIGADAE